MRYVRVRGGGVCFFVCFVHKNKHIHSPSASFLNIAFRNKREAQIDSMRRGLGGGRTVRSYNSSIASLAIFAVSARLIFASGRNVPFSDPSAFVSPEMISSA